MYKRQVFQLIDVRHPPTKDDLMMVDFLIQNEFPFVIVLTKKDKLSKDVYKRQIWMCWMNCIRLDRSDLCLIFLILRKGIDECRFL